HARGVGDGAAFGRRRGGRQAHRGGVHIVGHHRGHRRRVHRQAFIVATRGTGDRRGHVGGGDSVQASGRAHRHRPVAGAHPNGDGPAVIDHHVHRAAAHLSAHARGVGDGAAFGRRRGGRQAHRGGVHIVGHHRGHRRRVHRQAFIVATRGTGDRRGHVGGG